MSISYSAIVGHGSGKVTLPSVVSGFGTLNILKDPPKGVYTRRKDKVGETSEITSMIDESGDRACEAILHYARGVNPFVSVSYNNHGNDGGQRSGGMQIGGGRSARMPYSIGPQGSFRPPVVPPEQLLPLSRLPRAWTKCTAQPGYADFTKKLACPGNSDEYRCVKDTTLKACVRPTATYKLETPIVENFKFKYVIQNPVEVSASSGMRTMDLTTQNVGNPTKEIDRNMMQYSSRTHATSNERHVYNSEIDTTGYVQEDMIHPEGYTNVSTNQVYIDNNEVDTSPFIQDPVLGEGHTNIGSSNIVQDIDTSNLSTQRYTQDTMHSNVISRKTMGSNVTSIDDNINVDVRTRNPLNISHNSRKTGHGKVSYIHEDMSLSRSLPAYKANTNVKQNIYKNNNGNYSKVHKRNMPTHTYSTNGGVRNISHIDTTTNRSYNLAPTINPGGFEGRGTKPMTERMQNVNEQFQSDKIQMQSKINSMFEGRYQNNHLIPVR